MDTQQTTPPTSLRKTLIKLMITLVCIAGLVFALFTFTPKGFDINLSKVGQGQPALVFVYDSNLTASAPQAKQINAARSAIQNNPAAGDMHFLMAKIGRPDAEAFMQKYNVRAIDFILLDGKGKPLQVARGPLSAQQIQALVTPLLTR